LRNEKTKGKGFAWIARQTPLAHGASLNGSALTELGSWRKASRISDFRNQRMASPATGAGNPLRFYATSQKPSQKSFRMARICALEDVAWGLSFFSNHSTLHSYNPAEKSSCSWISRRVPSVSTGVKVASFGRSFSTPQTVFSIGFHSFPDL